jgi:hypothetical protein
MAVKMPQASLFNTRSSIGTGGSQLASAMDAGNNYWSPNTITSPKLPSTQTGVVFDPNNIDYAHHYQNMEDPTYADAFNKFAQQKSTVDPGFISDLQNKIDSAYEPQSGLGVTNNAPSTSGNGLLNLNASSDMFTNRNPVKGSLDPKIYGESTPGLGGSPSDIRTIGTLSKEVQSQPNQPPAVGTLNLYGQTDLARTETPGLTLDDGGRTKEYAAGNMGGQISPIVPTSTIQSPTQSKPYKSEQSSGPWGGNEAVQSATAIAGNVAQNLSQTKKDFAANEYANKVAAQPGEAMYWLDPNSDVRPDIEKYMATTPSALESLKKSTWLGGSYHNTGSDAGNVATAVVDPLGGITEASGLFKKGQANYVAEHAQQKAVEGLKGGVVSMVINGVWGIVEGFMNWDTAEKQDEKAKQEARDLASKALRTWEINQSKKRNLIMAQQEATSLAKKKERSATKVKNAMDNRSRLMGMLDLAKSNQQGIVNKRKSVWQGTAA